MTEILPIPSTNGGAAKRKFGVVAFEGDERTTLVAETSAGRVVPPQVDDSLLQSIAARLAAGLEVGIDSIVLREVAPSDRLKSWGYA